MFKDSIDLVFVVVIGVVVDDDEEDIEFVKKISALQIKTYKKQVKIKILLTGLYPSVIVKNRGKK